MMKHTCIILPALIALASVASSQDVEQPAATDFVIRLRAEPGFAHTHRQIVVAGHRVAVVELATFRGVLFEPLPEDNWIVTVVTASTGADVDLLPVPDPEPEPPPSEPDPDPEPPPPAYELPEVLFTAEAVTPLGTWYATDENTSAFQEILAKLFDGNAGTKWLAWESDPILQLHTLAPITITGLSLTSANDAAARDPAVLRLTVGETGQEILLDVPAFSSRRQALQIALPAPITTRRLRIAMLNRGDTRTQLAELELLYD